MVNPTPTSFYTDGGVYDESTVVPNDVIATDTTPSTSHSSFFADGNVVGTATVVDNDRVPDPTPSNTPSSSYVDGGAVDEGTVVDNDYTAASITPSKTPSSFYPNGNLYNEADVNISASYASDAAASAAAALVSENNADASEAAALASKNAAALSEAHAATSASNAANSETNAASSAAAAAASEANAASSAVTATTQAGIATTKASEASTSASNAATSETNADTSETNAAASAAAAATSETNAAATLAGAVRHDIAQSLSSPAQAQARSNIGAQISGSYQAALGYTPVNAAGDTMTGALRFQNAGEHERYCDGTYGTLQYSDQTNYYILLTNAGDQFGGWNGLRPFMVSLSNGNVTMSHSVYVGGTLNIGGGAYSGTAGDVNVSRPSSPGTGYVFIGNSGARYIGFDGSNYVMPSSHLYTAAGRVLGSSTDAGLVVNGRLAYYTDLTHGANTGLQENYPGCCITGMSNNTYPYGYTFVARYRQMQLCNLAGGWFACNYA